MPPTKQQRVVNRQARLRQRIHQDTPVITLHAKKGDPGLQSPRDVGRGIGRGAAAVTTRKKYTATQLLTAELLAGAGIVALRTVGDYVPQQDGTLKGVIAHPQGQLGPLPTLAGLIGTFFLLSFLAARGGTRAKVAVIAGGIVILVLAMHSTDEFKTVADTFSHFGHARVPPGAWQTSGNIAGAPVSGTLASQGSDSGDSGGSSSSGGGQGKRSLIITGPPEPA
jgi:hypothetical protein